MKDTGVGIQDPLFFIGVVENNVDERLEKRVQVRAFGVHGTVDQVPTESLPWAVLVCGNYDPNTPLPPVNSFVFGFFVDGRDAQQPMILGLIPTQMTTQIDPSVTGWGSIPRGNARLLARGSTPEDFGQPSNSKLERGEDLDQTYVLTQEMNRIKDIRVAKSFDDETVPSWSEPAPAYNAEYPFNRVIETANHSIELDDTPGSERITIHHKSGSYISVDARGTTVQKSSSDKYEINDTHQHVYIGGKSFVTIEGDSRVLVKGNKIEEIDGDYIQTIRGNHMISVAGQMNLNASEEIQMRAAKIRIESNVDGINLKSSKTIKIQSSKSTHIRSGDGVFMQSSNALNLKSGTSFFIGSKDIGHILADDVRIGGGSLVNINASNVKIDDYVSLANGEAINPSLASSSENSESTEMPPPAAKSISTTRHKNTNSLGFSGYTATDEIVSFNTKGSSGADSASIFSAAANANMSLIDLIKSFEGFSQYPYEDYGQWSIGYGTGIGPSSQAPKIDGPISEEHATLLLQEELQRFIVNVETINVRGNYNWTQESKDALTSFAYNIGSINELTANGTRDNQTIADKMLEYVNAGNVRLNSLVQRRKIEREKFLNGLRGTEPQQLLV